MTVVEQESVRPVRPALGRTVDEIMRAFMALHGEWQGYGYVEAVLMFNRMGSRAAYRWMWSWRGELRLGVSELEGFGIREATPAEYEDLEDGMRRGWVQIELYLRVNRRRTVMHQATGSAPGEGGGK